MKILLKDGFVISDEVKKASVFINKGFIEDIQQNFDGLQADQVVDCSDKYIVPGLIDMHVHLREPGYEYKETIASGSLAAVKGGVTTVCCMANTSPVVDNASIVKWIKDKAKQAGYIDVFPYACLTKGMRGEELTEMGDLLENGACGFSDDGRPVMNSEIMRRGLEYSKHFGSFIACHEEDLNLFNNGSIHEGEVSAKYGMRGAPAEAESIMVARDIELCRLTGGHAHICHISSRHSVELIRRAKEQGINITGEVTANHLHLTDSSCSDYDTNSKINPPFRTEDDRLALLEGVKSGVIDCIASDHAPHHIDDKFKEYDLAAYGAISLQLTLPLLLRLIRQGVLSWIDFVRITASNPANILRLSDRGVLRKGKLADIAVIDSEYRYKYDNVVNRSKSKNTLFWEAEMEGIVEYVLKKGKLIHTLTI